MVLIPSMVITGWSETHGVLTSVRMVTLELREKLLLNVVWIRLPLMVSVVLVMKNPLRFAVNAVSSLTVLTLLRSRLLVDKFVHNYVEQDQYNNRIINTFIVILYIYSTYKNVNKISNFYLIN